MTIRKAGSLNAAPQPKPALSQELADYVCGARLDGIDPAAIQRTKEIIAAHVGQAFGGILLDGAGALGSAAIAQALSAGAGSVSIIGQREKATLADAVLANCMLIRALDQGDVAFPAGVHPGLIAVPLALGMAEQTRCSGAELICAIVTAYEVMGKLGRHTWSLGAWRRRIAPLASLGAVAVAGRLLGLNREQMAIAMGYGGMTAMELAEGGSPAGPITHYYGLVCRTGLTSAYIARSGRAGAPYGLDAPSGFLETYCGARNFDGQAFAAALGRDYEVLTAAEKRYPGASLNQVAIERMRDFMAAHGLTADNVARIAISLPVEREGLDAGHFKGPFTGRKEAIDSVGFQLALLLLGGEVNPSQYANIGDPAVQALVDLCDIDFVSGKALRYVGLDILTKDGRRLTGQGDNFMHPPPPPREVMTRAAAGLLPQAKIDRFAGLLETLESVADASELAKCLAL